MNIRLKERFDITMKKKLIFGLCSFVLLCALVLTACSGCACSGCACAENSDLAGKWTSTSETGTYLSFSSTGKVIMSGDGVTLSGTYTADGTTLKMKLNAPNDTVLDITAQYKVEENKLSLTNELGYVEVFMK